MKMFMAQTETVMTSNKGVNNGDAKYTRINGKMWCGSFNSSLHDKDDFFSITDTFRFENSEKIIVVWLKPYSCQIIYTRI